MSLVDVWCDLLEEKRRKLAWTSRQEAQEFWEGVHEHGEELSLHMDPKYQYQASIDQVVDDQHEMQY